MTISASLINNKNDANDIFISYLALGKIEEAISVAIDNKLYIEECAVLEESENVFQVINPLSLVFHYKVNPIDSEKLMPFFSPTLFYKKPNLFIEHEKDIFKNKVNVYNEELIYDESFDQKNELIYFQIFTPLTTLMNNYIADKENSDIKKDPSHFLKEQAQHLHEKYSKYIPESDVRSLFYKTMFSDFKWTKNLIKNFYTLDQQIHHYSELLINVAPYHHNYQQLLIKMQHQIKEITPTSLHNFTVVEGYHSDTYLDKMLKKKYYSIALNIVSNSAFIHKDKISVLPQMIKSFIQSRSEEDRNEIKEMITKVMLSGINVEDPVKGAKSFKIYCDNLRKENITTTQREKDNTIYIVDYIKSLYVLSDKEFLKQKFELDKPQHKMTKRL